MIEYLIQTSVLTVEVLLKCQVKVFLHEIYYVMDRHSLPTFYFIIFICNV